MPAILKGLGKKLVPLFTVCFKIYIKVKISRLHSHAFVQKNISIYIFETVLLVQIFTFSTVLIGTHQIFIHNYLFNNLMTEVSHFHIPKCCSNIFYEILVPIIPFSITNFTAVQVVFLFLRSDSLSSLFTFIVILYFTGIQI